MSKSKGTFFTFIYMNLMMLIACWGIYGLLARDPMSPVHNGHPGFWTCMRFLIFIGVLLSAWLAYWDNRNPKISKLSAEAICEKGTRYWMRQYMLSMVARWVGIAVWAFFALRILYSGQTIPAAFALPGYFALVTSVVLAFSAAAYFYYRNKLCRSGEHPHNR